MKKLLEAYFSCFREAAAITIGVFGMWLGIQFPMGVFENIL